MALFGAPIASSTAASDGLQAAIGMQREMEVLNRSRIARGLPPCRIGIGLYCDRPWPTISDRPTACSTRPLAIR
jgi:hypothetical protein